MGNFLAELKRRHVCRAGGAYAVVAFGLIEIVSNVTPMLDLPAWLGRAVILLLIVGFPITLFAAWMIEAKPAEDAPAPTATKSDFALMAALALVAGLLVYQQVGPSQRATISAVPAGAASIAVLPFVNLSSDPEQEFFSDGMTEEITSALAKVKDLQVVGRTSSFAFKGQSKDLRAIGKALNANYLLEGSVRKSGSRVRITGQLIRADSGAHIWTENYDRELTDIFATQDGIAKAIAEALQVPLGLKAGETLVANRNISPENYQQYLRARAVYHGRGGIGRKAELETVSLLEPLVAAEPNYAPAWALLALAYTASPQNSQFFTDSRPDQMDALREVVAAAKVKARAAAQRAIDLDPRSAEGYAALSLAQPKEQLLIKEDFFKRALELEPANPDVLHFYSIALADVGRVKEAVALRQRLLAIEPLVPVFNSVTALIFQLDGQYEPALALIKALPETNINRYSGLAELYILMGRADIAADTILSAPPGAFLPGQGEAAARLIRRLPAKAPPQDLPEMNGRLGFVYTYVAPERARILIDYPIGLSFHWQMPARALIRKTEAFKEAARKAGYVEYWRARGWPAVCHPVGADDFSCD